MLVEDHSARRGRLSAVRRSRRGSLGALSGLHQEAPSAAGNPDLGGAQRRASDRDPLPQARWQRRSRTTTRCPPGRSSGSPTLGGDRRYRLLRSLPLVASVPASVAGGRVASASGGQWSRAALRASAAAARSGSPDRAISSPSSCPSTPQLFRDGTSEPEAYSARG